MKFLIDQPVSPLLAEWLRSQGHDAFHLRERGLSCAKDSEVFAIAVAETRIMVTADLDFSRLLALSGRDGPGLILFRAGNISDSRMLELLQLVLRTVEPQRLKQSVVVCEPATIRVASLPIRPDLPEPTRPTSSS